MVILLSTSFMRSHSSKDMKMGHNNEPIIMGKAIQKSTLDSDSTIHHILFISKVGLIQNVHHHHMHASPDFLGLARINGDVKPIFVEVKCRTRNNTALIERNLISATNPTFLSVIAGDENFHSNILRKSEKMQLLHQAATINIRDGLFLIGNSNGDIIRGIWIHFSDDLIQSYQLCVNDIHERHFKFTSNALQGENAPLSYINSDDKAAIDSAIEKQTYVDWNSFAYNFKMWVALRKCNLPLLSSRQVVHLRFFLFHLLCSHTKTAIGAFIQKTAFMLYHLSVSKETN